MFRMLNKLSILLLSLSVMLAMVMPVCAAEIDDAKRVVSLTSSINIEGQTNATPL